MCLHIRNISFSKCPYASFHGSDKIGFNLYFKNIFEFVIQLYFAFVIRFVKFKNAFFFKTSDSKETIVFYWCEETHYPIKTRFSSEIKYRELFRILPNNYVTIAVDTFSFCKLCHSKQQKLSHIWRRHCKCGLQLKWRWTPNDWILNTQCLSIILVTRALLSLTYVWFS